jgi:hypothetical protein
MAMGDSIRTALAALALALGLAGQAASARADGVEPASESATRVIEWVLAATDNRGLPFAVIDKTAAEIFVFDPDGHLQGEAPVLIGLTPGDDSAPGVGQLKIADIPPEERTTPAGRFVASYGAASGHRKVLWVDYPASISLHPVITSNPKEERLQRLQSPSADDNRITYGCINVPAAFYEAVVRKAFADAGGIVYILPDTKSLEEVFPALAVRPAGAAAPTIAAGPSGVAAAPAR